MYSKIMVPIDLGHVDHLDKALRTAADISKSYQAPICYVGVTSSAPSEVAASPQDFAMKLDAFAQAQASTHGVSTSALALTSHDPSVDLNATLTKAIADTGADLVVMATHVPNISDYLWSSHGGDIASHTNVSVFLVR